MTVRAIVRMGDPILRQRARALIEDEIRTTETQCLIDDMVETMRDASGAGIAAPQVGESVRVCIIEVEGNSRYPQFPPIPLTILINPRLEPLVRTSPNVSPELATELVTEDSITLYEGCLSVPGLRGRVRRPRRIRWSALDPSGKAISGTWSGISAAIIQHECDHLDGVLFVDRAEPRSLTFLEEYLRHVPESERVVDGEGVLA